jgi:arylsulfatase A
MLRLLAAASLGLLISTLCGTVHAAAPNGKPYNFVVVLADDIGAKELACYGHAEHQTPQLDRLAKEGMRFETCYVTPICSATRVLVMTGQYAFHSGWFHLIGRPYAPLPASPDFDIGKKVTFADVLKAKGYATGLAGKWQLSGKVPTLIHDCGFDEYRMWAYSENLPAGIVHTGEFEGGGRTSRYWHPSIVENGKYLPTKPTDYGPDLFNEFAIDFIRRHKDQPFCFYYPMPLTHGPHVETPDPSKPGKKRQRGFRSNVEYLDYLMGNLVQAIDDAGIGENTLFVFIGDNGTAGSGKGTVTELGARVPLIVRCPGTVKRGVVSPELANGADIFPTLLELAGSSLPSGHMIDGKSLLPTLRGESAAHRPWLFSYLGTGRILRTDRWLLEDEGNGTIRFIDCGDSRDGSGYRDVTGSSDGEAAAARKELERILKDLPGPEGHTGLRQPGTDGPKGKGKAKKNKAKTKP